MLSLLKYLVVHVFIQSQCGRIGTVSILATMGLPITPSMQLMPVLLLEVGGLELDLGYVEFNFLWRMRARGVLTDPFALRHGSYMMDLDDEYLPEQIPTVLDVTGIFMPVD